MSGIADPADPVFGLHERGKLEARGKATLRPGEDLARVGTPGFTPVAGRFRATRQGLTAGRTRATPWLGNPEVVAAAAIESGAARRPVSSDRPFDCGPAMPEREITMNRVHNTGITHPKPYFSEAEGLEKKAELDAYLDKKMEEWKRTVPFASHLTDKKLHQAYYRRTLIEHVWRIRLSRVSQSKAIYKIAQISPKAAHDYALYQGEEMMHDRLYMADCEAAGITMEEIYNTEPYLSTRLFEGFFYYALEHESPLAPVVSNYLVEYTQQKLQPAIVTSLQEKLGKDMVKGQAAHLHVDTTEDHAMEMWKILSQLIFSEEDFQSVFKYIDDVQEILAMFFREIYEDTVAKTSAEATPESESVTVA